MHVLFIITFNHIYIGMESEDGDIGGDTGGMVATTPSVTDSGSSAAIETRRRVSLSLSLSLSLGGLGKPQCSMFA